MPSDDFVVNVKQIINYPLRTTGPLPTDLLLIQDNSVGAGPYNSITVPSLVGGALLMGGFMRLAPGSGIAWNGASLVWNNGLFAFSEPVTAPSMLIGTDPVATQAFVRGQIDQFTKGVTSFNFRTGDVLLEEGDILRAGGAPQLNPHLHGVCTAPSVWDERQNDDTIATTNWVHRAFAFDLSQSPILLSPDCTQVAHPLNTQDINAAYGVINIFPAAPNPPLGDASNRIATTLFVDDTLADFQQAVVDQIINSLSGQFAPLDSPQFTGTPSAPTANPGTTTGQLATTAFVMNAVTASTAGVSSFNARTGAVVLTGGDISGAGGALLVSPIFTGVPTAPNAAPGTNSQQLATTAFVTAALAAAPSAGVTSFNTRTGAVTLTAADVAAVGAAPLLSPAFTGTPTAPTAPQTSNDTTLATTAYVRGAITTAAGVTSFNTRTGTVTLQASDVSAAGGALVVSPTFTGTPLAPTAVAGTNTTQIATTAFVTAALAAIGSGVMSFNGRTGAVTLTLADVTDAGGAPLASPAFSGTPNAPTPAQTSNDTTLATTSFVHAAVAVAPVGVTSFNARTGAITLTSSDVSAAGGALVSSPTFTGTPSAPTATAGTNTNQLATCAFVLSQIATAGGVISFNGRAGAVTLTTADITGAGGAPVASPAFTGAPTAPTATTGTNTTQIATTAFVLAQIAATTGVSTFNGRAGTVTLSLADITGAGGAPLASPTFTGVPAAPTATPGTNTTQLATTAFVAAAAGAGAQPGNKVRLAQVVVTAPVNQVVFTNIATYAATYDEFEIEYYSLQFSASGLFIGRVSQDNGATWLIDANYQFGFFEISVTAGGSGLVQSVAASYAQMSGTCTAHPSFRMEGSIRFALPLKTDRWKTFKFDRTDYTATYGWTRWFGTWAYVGNLGAINAIQLRPDSSANFTEGTFNLYGIVK